MISDNAQAHRLRQLQRELRRHYENEENLEHVCVVVVYCMYHLIMFLLVLQCKIHYPNMRAKMFGAAQWKEERHVSKRPWYRVYVDRVPDLEKGRCLLRNDRALCHVRLFAYLYHLHVHVCLCLFVCIFQLYYVDYGTYVTDACVGDVYRMPLKFTQLPMQAIRGDFEGYVKWKDVSQVVVVVFYNLLLLLLCSLLL